jgi:hypothetical protein
MLTLSHPFPQEGRQLPLMLQTGVRKPIRVFPDKRLDLRHLIGREGRSPSAKPQLTTPLMFDGSNALTNSSVPSVVVPR